MGVNLRDIINAKEIELESLGQKILAFDAFNTLYQFLTIIRQRDGTPLIDRKGRVTSHLSGTFYRMVNLMSYGIKPCWVFDGEPPDFKKSTILERERRKEEAEEKYKDALEKGREEELMLYAQQTARLSQEMVSDTRELLDAMGIPWIQAPSEGEAMCAHIVKKGDAYATVSQDYDSLLYGSPLLIRNLNITGKRKLPRKEVYIEIRPEIIELKNILDELKIDQERLILIGLLLGTDYNPGIKGIGPKKALEIVRKHKEPEKIMKEVKWEFEIPWQDIFNWFIKPKVSDRYEIRFKEINKERIKRVLCDEHDFSEERVENALSSIIKKQEGLNKWFKR
ncbi:MAG: flap endonuclease-1 [Candidatus Parvarchaeota archaeon]|nr:flap endonuclease-1 [Candidatus Jingweiarchaeum tengchongense]MCW1297894.1 flap endonuclease-1 [Candidatus Jingweiarchaeum tengchongense]MCW1299905.1 flap endonuclease-1 [Candidatus Jingweiarchaeum tengchongense]MCW1305091.1 flap endonuclease-1 [Candidatus Jingweiarchaeum tengchongense]MCW1305153.1 flap endonuclease-1 [Candidatus Jingweiarchaeum tengchongense]